MVHGLIFIETVRGPFSAPDWLIASGRDSVSWDSLAMLLVVYFIWNLVTYMTCTLALTALNVF